MFEPAQIPGMIEPIEQQTLVGLAADPFVADNGAIVEFGTFFGRSTTCLIKGALNWWSPERPPAVYAFDSFSCIGGHGFAAEVMMWAEKFGVTRLLEVESDHINFRGVYDHFVGEAEAQGVLQTTTSELRNSQWPGDRIALMHLDSPKFYEELKFVLTRFFPALVPGAHVVFQDYFYHWSAGLIAGTQLLIEWGFLAMERSAASALVTKVLRAPSLAEVRDLDRAMGDASIPALIDRGIAAAKAIPIDRPEQFIPRLHFARMQHLWTLGDFARAEESFLKMLSDGGNTMNTGMFLDFRDLLRHGFDVRKAYELDHAE
jgi:hypothetical protein